MSLDSDKLWILKDGVVDKFSDQVRIIGLLGETLEDGHAVNCHLENKCTELCESLRCVLGRLLGHTGKLIDRLRAIEHS
jgi:hypothetical protein